MSNKLDPNGAPTSEANTLPIKTLILYGTRYGATASSAEDIAKVLVSDGQDVKVVDAKLEKVKTISDYELIIVGSGLSMGGWASEAEDFLKVFHHELGEKKLALFASTMKTMAEREGKAGQVAKTQKMAFDDNVTKYSLHPIALGLFGGVLDFNKMGALTRMTMGLARSQLEKDGFKEAPIGVYDLRNWDEIRGWARELAEKTHRQD